MSVVCSPEIMRAPELGATEPLRHSLHQVINTSLQGRPTSRRGSIKLKGPRINPRPLAIRLEDIAFRLEAMATRVEAIKLKGSCSWHPGMATQGMV